MYIEKQIANKLRKALDIASNKHEFRNLYPFDNFPYECCEHTCDLLGYLLSESGISAVKINGASIYDSSAHHVWLLTDKDIVIDITESQFTDEFLDPQDIKNVRVGKNGPVQERFSSDVQIYNLENFTDPDSFYTFNREPTPYQQRLIDVFKVLQKYL